MSDQPLPLSLYRHRKGGEYIFMLLGKDEATQTDVAIYRSKVNQQVWVRPLADFCEPRFTRILMYNPEQILPLLDEVAAAKKRAAELQKHDTLTLAEKLDIWHGADQAAANRFDVVAQAYRELAAVDWVKLELGIRYKLPLQDVEVEIIGDKTRRIVCLERDPDPVDGGFAWVDTEGNSYELDTATHWRYATPAPQL